MKRPATNEIDTDDAARTVVGSEKLLELRGHWTLLLAATIGMSLPSVVLYSLGPLLAEISRDTGWSRTEITLGQTMQSFLSILTAPLCGILIDRFGSRKVALPATIAYCAAIIALAFADSSLQAWYGAWILLSIGAIGLKPNVWTGAVASAFQRSRGLAFAIVISGSTLASAIVPTVATKLLLTHGWQTAYAILGVTWATMVIPTVWLWLRPTPASVRRLQPDGTTSSRRTSIAACLRSPLFAKLAVIGFLFSLLIVSITFHIVPMMRDKGLGPLPAAGIAGMIGVFSVIGRLATGALLDRFAARVVGSIALSLPFVPLCMLLFVETSDFYVLASIAMLLGLSLGSELDLLAFLTSRHFGAENYGTIFGFIISVLASATSLGPVLASLVRDETGSYDLIYIAGLPIVLYCGLLVFSIGRPGAADATAAQP